MKIKHYSIIPENTETCCTKTTIKELTPQDIGIPNLNVKIFEMQPGGFSPLHQHSELHRLFITNGEGMVFDSKKTRLLQAGDIVYIDSNEPHQLKTVGEKPLKFITLTIEPK